MEVSVDTKLSIQGVTGIHIQMVASCPTERPPFLDLQTRQINRTALQEIEMFLGKVRPHNRHEIDWTIERSGGRKKGSSSAKDFLNSLKRRFYCIESN